MDVPSDSVLTAGNGTLVALPGLLWSLLRESNSRPFPYHGNALPTELRRLVKAKSATLRAAAQPDCGRFLTGGWPGTVRGVQVRRATIADAAALCRIYNVEVEQSTTTLDMEPRSLEGQQRYLADRSGGLAVVVAELDEDVVGFASLSFYRDRAGYRTSVEDSIYVDRGHHGKGVGHALLGELVSLAIGHGFHAMFARIVDEQPASIGLHRQHGFELVGVEREVARKFGRWHDVALMQRML